MDAVSRSRRDRPAKPPLTRQWIVAETIAIMDAEGLERATMRRVALALDTGPASLYAYVADTAELHAAVLDALLERLPVPSTGDWASRLRRLLREYRRLLGARPGLARSALLRRPVGSGGDRLRATVRGLLEEGGAHPDGADWGTDALLLHATAAAAERAAPATAAGPASPPHAVEGDERADWAVRALIAGIVATPVPDPGA